MEPKRRLSAVWFADIVGYSALSNRDEPAALALVDILQSLCREIVAVYEGRIVKFIGDAALVEFASTDSAVRAAVALQERFVASAADRRLDSCLRIGVHLGEVNATPDGDLYGDGINTASRLHQKATPGQVIISEDVWRQLRQRPEFRFAALGAVELRGITTRLEIYDVLFGSRAALASTGRTPPATRHAAVASKRPYLVWGGAIVAALAIGAAVAITRNTPVPQPQPAPQPQPQPEVQAPAPAVQPTVTAPTEATDASATVPPPRPATTRGATARAARKPEPPPAEPEAQKPETQKPEAQKPAVEPVPPAVTQARPPEQLPAPPVPAVRPQPSEDPADPFPMPEVRRLLERLAAALSDRAPQAIAALGPGARMMSGRGVQQMSATFGEGLAVRVGRMEPGEVRGGAMTIRFFLLARSDSRDEMPLAFIAVIERGEGGLQFAELRRDWQGGRGGLR